MVGESYLLYLYNVQARQSTIELDAKAKLVTYLLHYSETILKKSNNNDNTLNKHNIRYLGSYTNKN